MGEFVIVFACVIFGAAFLVALAVAAAFVALRLLWPGKEKLNRRRKNG